MLARAAIAPVVVLFTAGAAAAGDVRAILKLVEPCTAVVVTETALGSAFLVSPDGLLITNHHVVEGARSAAVRLHGGDVYDQVWRVFEDPFKDFAILRIAGFGLPHCRLADSSKVEVGQEVLAIGNPHGLQFTVSTGIVSALRSDLGGEQLGYQVIQTTAPISPGSSGGPLLDSDGQVIGITTFKLATGENLNFAVPINYVRGALAGLSESDRRGSAMASLTGQAPVARKATVAFRDLTWGMTLAEVERRLAQRLKRNKKPRDPVALTDLPGLTTHTATDTLLGRRLDIELWLDPRGLGAVSVVETLKAPEGGEFVRDLLSALGRNYGKPSDGAAEEDSLWAVWTDREGNSVTLEVEAVRCGRLPIARGTCFALSLVYLRSDLASRVAKRLDERLDPF